MLKNIYSFDNLTKYLHVEKTIINQNVVFMHHYRSPDNHDYQLMKTCVREIKLHHRASRLQSQICDGHQETEKANQHLNFWVSKQKQTPRQMFQK